jgi:hypothetical protein
MDDFTCETLLKVIEYAEESPDKGPDKVWECKTKETNGKSKILTLEDLENLPDEIKQQFESAGTTLTIPGAKVTGNGIKIPRMSRQRLKRSRRKTIVSFCRVEKRRFLWFESRLQVLVRLPLLLHDLEIVSLEPMATL